MEQRVALPLVAALGLTSLLGAVALPAAGDATKPGTIATVAGTGMPGFSGDGGPATQAQLGGPSGLALDAAGNLYIAEWNNDRVRKVDAGTGIITTVVGTGKPGFSGDGGKATDAQLNRPWLLVVDGAGNLYISDFYNHRVRKVTPDGIITTFAGSGPVETTTDPTAVPQKGGFSGDNGLATDAQLNGPIGLAVDAHGNLLIGDAFNNRVRKVSSEGVITTVAGNGTRRPSGDGGLATEAGFTTPGGLAVDAGGDLFITETGSAIDGRAGTVMGSRVRKVDAATGIITTVAGTDEVGFSGDGGKAMDARLNNPGTVAVDSAGNLFIADGGNYRVRKVDAVTGIITTVAGNGKRPYAGDGSLATETGLRGPGVLAIDATGSLLIQDEGHDGNSGGLVPDGRVLKVYGVAAPGLLAGMAFPR